LIIQFHLDTSPSGGAGFLLGVSNQSQPVIFEHKPQYEMVIDGISPNLFPAIFREGHLNVRRLARACPNHVGLHADLEGQRPN
jgi:hypothetical protein